MNLMSFVSLIAFFTFLFSGVYVFLDDTRSRLHHQFLALAIAFAAYALAYVFIYLAPSKEFASVWFRISSVGWTLFPAILLNFSLTLSGRDKRLKNMILQPLIFFPGVVFLFRSLVYSLYASDFTWYDNFWKFVPEFSSPWLWLFLFYLNAYLIFSFVIILKWTLKTPLKKFKIKGTIILWMLTAGYILSMTSNVILPLVNIHSLPEFAHLSCALLIVGMGFAIVKYKHNPLSPESVGERLFNTTSDLVIITDDHLQILDINSTGAKIMGYNSTNLIGIPFHKIAKLPHNWPPIDNSNPDSDNKSTIETKLLTKDGGQVPATINGRAVYDDYQDFTGFIFVASDQRTMLDLNHAVEERRELQYELTKAIEKAAESDTLKSTFLSNISHELRTPLNGILGFAEILKLELENSTFSEIADHIDRSGNRLLGTLNSIIDLSLIEANRNEINKQPVNICTLVEKKAAIYKNYAGSKDLDMEINVGDNAIMSRTDQRLLGHVLSNLLDNAIKYTETGSVKISCNQISSGNRFWAMISVKDTGIGIDKNDFSKIFERFRQSSEGQNRAYEGVGIGLSICKHFVELLDGEIWLESDIGKGSVFYVKIPSYMPDAKKILLEQAKPPDTGQKQSPEKPERFRPCILIVEDEKTNREYMKYLLSELYDVDTAENGISALERAAKFRYDMIFMDVNLSREMTGVEAMKKIRDIEHYKACPIAAVTANVLKNNREDLLEKGFSHYLAKPYSRDQLISLSKEMLVCFKE